MPVPSLVVPNDGVDDVTSASIFNEMKKPVDTLNEHMAGTTGSGATKHADTHILMTTLDESTAVVQNPADQHKFNDMMMRAWSLFLGSVGGTNAAQRIGYIGSFTYAWALTLLKNHTHADAATGGQLTQVNTHQSADTDSAPTALHHTLGAGANQAAAGNHTHAGYEQTANKGAVNGYAALDSGGKVPVAQIPAGISITGNAATATSATTAGSAATATTATTALGVAAGVVGTAGLADGAVTAAKLAAASVSRASVAEGLVQAQAAPDKTVRLAASYTYYNASRVPKTVGGSSPAIDAVGSGGNALPTGSNLRIDLLYADDTGALVWKAGVPALSSPQDPVPDDLTKPLAYVGPVSATTTQITSGMIRDARPSPSAGGSGSGGGGGVDLSTKPFVTIGADGTLANETDLLTLVAGGYPAGTIRNAIDLGTFRVADAVLSNSSTDATMADVMESFISYNHIGALASNGSGALYWNAQANTGKIAVQIGTVRRYINVATALATRTTNSLTGQPPGRYLIFVDVTTAGVKTFTTTLVADGTTPAAGQMQVGAVWWDGAAFALGATGGIQYTTLPTFGSQNFAPMDVAIPSFAVTTAPIPISASPALLPGAPVVAARCAAPAMKVRAYYEGLFTQGAAASAFYLYLGYTTVGPSAAAAQYTLLSNNIYCGGIPANVTDFRSRRVKQTNLPTGDIWFTFLYVATGNTMANAQLINADLEFSR